MSRQDLNLGCQHRPVSHDWCSRCVSEQINQARAEGYKQGQEDEREVLIEIAEGCALFDSDESMMGEFLKRANARGIPKPDQQMGCCGCGKTLPHRWMPSPDAGPFWRCSECGQAYEPESDLAPTKPTPVKLENAKDLDWHLEPGEEEP